MKSEYSSIMLKLLVPNGGRPNADSVTFSLCRSATLRCRWSIGPFIAVIVEQTGQSGPSVNLEDGRTTPFDQSIKLELIN